MGHGKETPRQKMIGMMYLVLTALLALNVSADVLNAFALVDEGLVRTTANFVAKNASAYSIFDAEMDKSPTKVEPFRDKAWMVKEKADQLVYDLQQLKVEIIAYCDGGEKAPALSPTKWTIGTRGEMKDTYEINSNLIKNKDNTDKPAEIMINNKKGEELKKKIEEYREFLISLTSDPTLQKSLEDVLNTDDPPADKTGQHTWQSSRFEHLPMVAVVTNMSKMQGDVRNAEADIIQYLLQQIGATDTKVNKMEAIVLTKSNYVLRGSPFEARIVLAAYDSLQRPEILLGPYRRTGDDYEMIGEGRLLPYDAKGRAVYTSVASSVGTFPIQGLLRMQTPDGLRSYPFSTEYQVGEPNAVISPTKMNVMYIGVENPLSISVSGVPGESVRATISQGTLTKVGNEWIAKPTTVGNVTVTVTATVDGQTKVMGNPVFRVKQVPDPVAKVANRTGGRIDKATLVAQVAVLAALDNFDFDMRFEVTSFTVSALVGQFAQNATATGARITDQQRQILNRLNRGNKVYFEDIKARGPDGSTRDLPAISLTID